jgi:protein TonB
MLAYAANRPRVAERQSSPNILLIVLCAHIIVAAVVMSLKMDLPKRILNPPTTVISIPLPTDPPPRPVPTTQTPRTATESGQTVEPIVRAPTTTNRDVPIDLGAGPGPVMTGGGAATIANVPLPIPNVPVSTTPRFLTPPSEVKPPYPEAKLLAGEEAALTLRLTIDENGRVVAVEPVGHADPVFLAAARKHLMGHWRYKPATEDGRAVTSTIVINLRFELDA